MAPLPSNGTDRVFFDYVTGTADTSLEHTASVRFNLADSTVAQVQAGFLSVLEAIGAENFRPGWGVFAVRFQATGTDFSLPVTIDPDLADFTGTAGTGYIRTNEAIELKFVGRSPTSGRRTDVSIYTAQIGVGSSFRFEGGSSGFALQVRNAVLTLNSESAEGRFVAIDGSVANWYDYANVQYNSYWESRIRRG